MLDGLGRWWINCNHFYVALHCRWKTAFLSVDQVSLQILTSVSYSPWLRSQDFWKGGPHLSVATMSFSGTSQCVLHSNGAPYGHMNVKPLYMGFRSITARIACFALCTIFIHAGWIPSEMMNTTVVSLRLIRRSVFYWCQMLGGWHLSAFRSSNLRTKIALWQGMLSGRHYKTAWRQLVLKQTNWGQFPHSPT